MGERGEDDGLGLCLSSGIRMTPGQSIKLFQYPILDLKKLCTAILSLGRSSPSKSQDT